MSRAERPGREAACESSRRWPLAGRPRSWAQASGEECVHRRQAARAPAPDERPLGQFAKDGESDGRNVVGQISGGGDRCAPPQDRGSEVGVGRPRGLLVTESPGAVELSRASSSDPNGAVRAAAVLRWRWAAIGRTVELQAPLLAYPTSDGGCLRPTTGARVVITFLGTVLFMTILYIGSLDGRSGLSVL